MDTSSSNENEATMDGSDILKKAFGATVMSEKKYTVKKSTRRRTLKGRSLVWDQFEVNEGGNKVTCKQCGDQLSYSHSHSTSSMLKHLHRKHGINVYPPPKQSSNRPKTETDSNHDQQNSELRDVTPETSQPAPPENSTQQSRATSIQHGPLSFTEPCLKMRWTDHNDLVFKAFTDIYMREDYTDVTLVAEQTFFKAHRMILSSVSPVLDEMFKMTPPNHQPCVFLKDVKAVELRLMLDFIYKGEIAIPPTLLSNVIKIGEELKVKGLKDFPWNDNLASTLFQTTVPTQDPTAASPLASEIGNMAPSSTSSVSTDSLPVFQPDSCRTDVPGEPASVSERVKLSRSVPSVATPRPLFHRLTPLGSPMKRPGMPYTRTSFQSKTPGESVSPKPASSFGPRPQFKRICILKQSPTTAKHSTDPSTSSNLQGDSTTTVNRSNLEMAEAQTLLLFPGGGSSRTSTATVVQESNVEVPKPPNTCSRTKAHEKASSKSQQSDDDDDMNNKWTPELAQCSDTQTAVPYTLSSISSGSTQVLFTTSDGIKNDDEAMVM